MPGIFKFCERKPATISTNPSQMVWPWLSAGEADEQTVLDFAVNATPVQVATNVGTLFRNNFNLSPQSDDIYHVDVIYKEIVNKTGEWTFNFDGAGETINIKQSLANIANYAVGGGDAKDYQGALNVQEGKVEGLDVISPAMRFTITYKHPLGVLTFEQARTLSYMTGRTNSKKWLGFERGELLYLNANGSDGTTREAEIAYQFEARQNETDYSVGPITGIAKKGHEYLWAEFVEKTKTTGGLEYIVMEAEYAHVEQIYPEMDFAEVFGFGSENP